MLCLLSTLVYLITSVFVFYYSELSYLQGVCLWAFLCALQWVLSFKFTKSRWHYYVLCFVLVMINWSHLFYELNQRFVSSTPIEVTANIRLISNINTYDYQKVSEAIINYEFEGVQSRKKVKISAPLDMHFPSNCEFNAQIKLLRLRSTNNRFIYDGAKWTFINGIHARAKVLEVFSTCESINISPRDRIKNRILNMNELNANTKGMLLAVLFGDQSVLSDSTQALFVDTQTIHLMVVSGLHIGVCAWLAWLFGLLVYKVIPVRFWHVHSAHFNCVITMRHIQILSTIMLVLFYGYLAQFNPPALRAILMLLLPLMLWLLNQKMRLMLIWAYSLIALLLLMPAQVLSIGFWLSVISVSGLLCFFSIRYQINPIERSLKSKLINFVVQLFKTQWVIFLVMTPLICFMGSNLHGFSFVINLVLVPVVTLILVPLGLLLLLLDLGVLHDLINQLCHLILWFLEHFEDNSAISISINLKQLICLELAAFILLSAMTNKWPFISLFVLLAFMDTQSTFEQGEFNVTVLDVGQGQSVVIQTQSTQWIVDTGPGLNEQINSVSRTLIPYLKQHHSSNRVLALSHDDNDHVFGYELLLDAFDIQTIYAGQPQRMAQFANNCRMAQSVVVDAVEFRWLDMSGFMAQSDNDFSCVLMVKSQYGSILISGDLSKQGEYYLAQKLESIPVDVIVIGHHGSNSSTSDKWLNVTDAKIAIVSRALDSQFGHPHINVSERINRSGIKLLDTALGGQIRLGFSKHTQLTHKQTDKNITIQSDRNRLSATQ